MSGTLFKFLRQESMIKNRSKRRMVGYVSITEAGPNLAIQLSALQGVGCTKIFRERLNQRKGDGFEKALAYASQDDILVVLSLDRFFTQPELLPKECNTSINAEFCA